MSGGENEESPSIITSLWRRVRLGAQHRLARLRPEAKLCKPKAEPRGGFVAPVWAAIRGLAGGPEGPRQTPGGQKEPAGGPEGARRRAKPRARGPGPGPSEARPGAGARGRGPGPGARGSEPGPGAEGQGSGRARWSKAWPTLARLRELGEPGPRNPARARVGAQTTGAC